ncbi:M50 family metallopeptidase [Arenibaculum sp.]|uniref:M50 family metallopeptidase n=1 Tax=Arenibaculum sp. TaxID=2865862 RepID=UPI002E0FC336|nr:M50 family metallopeptidase [Arenibaculum sp.]
MTAPTGRPSRLSPEIEVQGAVPGHARRIELHHRGTDMSFVLGEAEFAVAELFDGRRSHAEILRTLADRRNVRLAPEKLQAFEERLIRLGILENEAAPPPVRRDPFAGISYGPFKSLLMLTLFRLRPDGVLSLALSGAPWLASPAFVRLLGLAVLAAAVSVAAAWPSFRADVANAYSGWGWLAWHYPILVASVTLHELGHALACRVQGVRTTEIGVAAYLLWVTGWARPVQREWSALGRRERMITIVMGPFASLVFAALAIGVWSLSPPGTMLAWVAVMAAVTSTLALIPTLLPIFNGDGYLALTEYFGLPGLRQKAWDHVRGRFLGTAVAEPSGSLRLIYLAVAFGTAISWAGAWTGIALLFLF